MWDSDKYAIPKRQLNLAGVRRGGKCGESGGREAESRKTTGLLVRLPRSDVRFGFGTAYASPKILSIRWLMSSRTFSLPPLTSAVAQPS